MDKFLSWGLQKFALVAFITLLITEAMEYFKDNSGRPGPASWEAGDYPEGPEAYPVSGVSWYEAAAYAAYAGKSLPSIDHWSSAAGLQPPVGI